jgi:phosphate transport system permease protein
MRRHRWHDGGIWLLRMVTYACAVTIVLILAKIVVAGAGSISLSFLTHMPSNGGTTGGIGPAIIGTVSLVGGALLLAFPLGLGAAIYLAEFARESSVTRLIRVSVLTLAGVPSIVFGLFGLGLFVVALGLGTSILAGSLTLALMVLPLIICASEEALRAVPDSLREGALALGASRWQTIRRVVLPRALPGILTGTILAVGRAAGETAPILFTAAVFFLPKLPQSIWDPVMALPYHIYVLATQTPDTALTIPLQYGTALVLIAVVLGLNTAAIVVRHFLDYRHEA